MGVPTFWKELEAAEERDTILGVATTKFQSSPGVRGFRLGIDASLWLFHMRKMAAMDASEVGANADVRTFFFRIVELISQGCLLLFVFDGPAKPKWKRGKRIGGGGPGFGNTNKKEDVLLRKLIDLFGMKRRVAPGEAEAELAAMAIRGEIDAVLTDDIDALIFGAPLVIRNPPKTGKLAGPTPSKADESVLEEPASTKSMPSAAASSTSKDVRRLYSSLNILDTLKLDRASMILVALFSGGDYHPQGVAFVGPKIGCALARCGFGRSLLLCLELHCDGSAEQKQAFAEWRVDVAEELRTDSQKFMSRKAPKLSKELPGQTDFPNPEIVRNYTTPNVSSGLEPPVWDTPVNLRQLVLYCSETFEWGNAELRARFRSLVYKPLLMLEIRRRALYDDRNADRIVPEASYQSEYEGSLFAEIRDRKNADSTHNVLSYRVRLDPLPFSTLIDEALPAIDPYPRAELSEDDFDVEGSPIKQRRAPKEYGDSITPFMHWIPVVYVEAHPDGREAVKRWEDKKASPRKKKPPAKTVPVLAAKGKGVSNTLMFKSTKGGVAKAEVGSKGKEKKKKDSDGFKAFLSPVTSPIKAKTRRTLFTVVDDEEDEPFVRDDEEDEPFVQDDEDDSDGDLPDPKSIGPQFGNAWGPPKVVVATNERQESPTKKRQVATPPALLVVDDEGSESSDGEELEVRELGARKKLGAASPPMGRALGHEVRSEEQRWGKCEVLEVSP